MNDYKKLAPMQRYEAWVLNKLATGNKVKHNFDYDPLEYEYETNEVLSGKRAKYVISQLIEARAITQTSNYWTAGVDFEEYVTKFNNKYGNVIAELTNVVYTDEVLKKIEYESGWNDGYAFEMKLECSTPKVVLSRVIKYTYGYRGSKIYNYDKGFILGQLEAIKELEV